MQIIMSDDDATASYSPHPEEEADAVVVTRPKCGPAAAWQQAVTNGGTLFQISVIKSQR